MHQTCRTLPITHAIPDFGILVLHLQQGADISPSWIQHMIREVDQCNWDESDTEYRPFENTSCVIVNVSASYAMPLSNLPRSSSNPPIPREEMRCQDFDPPWPTSPYGEKKMCRIERMLTFSTATRCEATLSSHVLLLIARWYGVPLTINRELGAKGEICFDRLPARNRQKRCMAITKSRILPIPENIMFITVAPHLSCSKQAIYSPLNRWGRTLIQKFDRSDVRCQEAWEVGDRVT